MIAYIAKILLGKKPVLNAPLAGARVNRCSPFFPEKYDGVALSNAKDGLVYVEWDRGGSGWERADKLSVIVD